MQFLRYAIYYVPPANAGWAQFGSAWLGWDSISGTVPPSVSLNDTLPIPQPDICATPRKYGLHATLKPPFCLRCGETETNLIEATRFLAENLEGASSDGLELARLGRFLALKPRGGEKEFITLAANCVRELDAFRAPLTPAELEKRNPSQLSASQKQNLLDWGYPYVMQEFRFHITMTGRMAKPDLAIVEQILRRKLDPLLPEPFLLQDVAVMGEADDGKFHLIERFPLKSPK